MNLSRVDRAIQMGRMPAFLYDDHPWIPYLGTSAGVRHFGFVGGYWDKNYTLMDMVKDIKAMTHDEYRNKMQYLHSIRHWFTYEGLFQQMEFFLRDPFGLNGGQLVCAIHPRSERCCG